MIQKNIIFLVFITFLVTACGDNSPFDEDYWDDPQVRNEDDDTNEEIFAFEVQLSPLSANLGNLSGNVKIDINATDVTSNITISEIPYSLILAESIITTQSCDEIALNNPPPPVLNPSGEFKDLNLTELGTREGLVNNLNQVNPQNGSSVNLDGKRYVMKAFISNTNSPIPENTTIIPIACGTIFKRVENGTSGGSTTGGGTGTIDGNTIGGTVGTITGGVGGIDGSIGGIFGGSVSGGTIGGATGGITGF